MAPPKFTTYQKISIPAKSLPVEKISNLQAARILAAFINYANEKAFVEERLQEMFDYLKPYFPNVNVLDSYLYELSEQGSIYYEETGEDGFRPFFLAGYTKKTAEHLLTHLDAIATTFAEKDGSRAVLEERLQDILTFDPDRLTNDILSANAQLKDARKAAEENNLLKPLLPQIQTIEKHLRGVSAVAEQYEEVYKNIIRPVQLEGKEGVKATVRWAVLSIIVSTAISLVISNWSELVKVFKP